MKTWKQIIISTILVASIIFFITGCSSEPSDRLIKYAVKEDTFEKISSKFIDRRITTNVIVNKYSLEHKTEKTINGQKMIKYQYYAQCTAKFAAPGNKPDASQEFNCGGAIQFVKMKNGKWEILVGMGNISGNGDIRWDN